MKSLLQIETIGAASVSRSGQINKKPMRGENKDVAEARKID